MSRETFKKFLRLGGEVRSQGKARREFESAGLASAPAGEGGTEALLREERNGEQARLVQMDAQHVLAIGQVSDHSFLPADCVPQVITRDGYGVDSSESSCSLAVRIEQLHAYAGTVRIRVERDPPDTG